MHSVKIAGLVIKRNSPPSSTLGRKISEWLEKHGIIVILATKSSTPAEIKELFSQVDVVIAIGGDGTFVRISRWLAGSGKPVVGINMGRVGFLAELSPDNWEEAFSEALEGSINIEQSMALKFEVMRDGNIVYSGSAVNDVVIARGGLARLMALGLKVDDNELIYLRADGLIISTPIGSTAYSGSAGGPILHSSLNVYSITAICPFSSHILPLVISADSVLCAKVLETSTRTYVTIDGQDLFRLETADVLKVSGLPDSIRFARFNKHNYYAKLRSTGFMIDSRGA